jgi:hypothetical protein
MGGRKIKQVLYQVKTALVPVGEGGDIRKGYRKVNVVEIVFTHV